MRTSRKQLETYEEGERAAYVTGRRSSLSEAARANIREIGGQRGKDVICEETADSRSIVSSVGDRAAF
jgi:hypothetical protein